MASSRATRRRRCALLVASSAVLVTAAACNVFSSLDHCADDGDCENGHCDLEGKFCLAGLDGGVDRGVEVSVDTGRESSAPPDVVSPTCDLAKPFQAPELVKGLEDLTVFSARFATGETQAFISALEETDGSTEPDIYTSTRADLASPFMGKGLLQVSRLGVSEYWPTVTADGTFMFFESDRSKTEIDGGYQPDRARIWFSKKEFSFSTATLQSVFATTSNFIEGAPYLDPQGRAIYFMSAGRAAIDGAGDLDLYESILNPATGSAQAPTSLGPNVNTPAAENAPVVSADQLTLYFARADVNGVNDVWMSRRPTSAGAFGTSTIVSAVQTEHDELPSYLSDDECRLYFVSNRDRTDGDAPGIESFRLYVATRPR